MSLCRFVKRRFRRTSFFRASVSRRRRSLVFSNKKLIYSLFLIIILGCLAHWQGAGIRNLMLQVRFWLVWKIQLLNSSYFRQNLFKHLLVEEAKKVDNPDILSKSFGEVKKSYHSMGLKVVLGT